MPYSHDAPKAWALDRIAELASTPTDEPFHVLDVGPGAGAWGNLVRSLIRPTVVDCIEAHGPYVDRFQLGLIYHQVFLGDVRQWDWGGCDYITVAESEKPIGPGTPKWTWDLVICGDVLEHMTMDEARAVVDQALVHAPAVLVVVPINDWPQGESEGNPLEAHVSTWEDGDLSTLPQFFDREFFNTSDGPITAALLGVWP